MSIGRILIFLALIALGMTLQDIHRDLQRMIELTPRRPGQQ